VPRAAELAASWGTIADGGEQITDALLDLTGAAGH
jgi:hypothetical protein